MSQARALGTTALTARRWHGLLALWIAVRALAPWLALVALTAAALALRLWGTEWRLPFTMNVDEPVVMDQAAAIVRTGDLNPHRFVYPSLQIYLQAAIDWAHLQWGIANGLYHGVENLPENTHVITTAPGFYLWGRAGTAALGALTVLCTGLAGRWLGGWGVGLTAALLLGVAGLHVGHSRYVTPDVPASCFTALALLGAVAVYRQPTDLGRGRRWLLYALAGVGFGLATATKYNAVVIGACLLVAHLARRPARAWLTSLDLWLAGVAAIVAFFVVTPFALFDRATFLADVASIIHHYKYLGHAGRESDQNWWWYLHWLLRNETWLIVPALAGAVWAALRHRSADVLLLVFPLLSYAGLAAYKVHFERNLLPLFPFFALLAARLIADLAGAPGRRWPGWRALALPATLICGALLAIAPWLDAAGIAAHQTRTDSRVAAVGWLRAHVPPTARVLADLQPELWGDQPNIDAAELVSHLHDQPLEWFAGLGYDYLVTNEDRITRLRQNRTRNAQQLAAYDRLFAETVEVARFGENGTEPGPEIRILSLAVFPDRLVMGQRLDARFEGLDLLGVTVAPVDGPASIAVFHERSSAAAMPGGFVGVTLYWWPTATLDTNYVVFVHLVDDQGRLVAQRDTPPRGGDSPTSTWQPGQLMVDPATVPLPADLPPGAYRILIGLYRVDDGRRLALQSPGGGPSDSLEIGTVRVSNAR